MSSSLRALARSHPSHRHTGHAHFWERARAQGISRGQFIRAASGATAAALGSGLWLPGLAHADSGTAAPLPIPGTLPGTPFHVVLPGPVDLGHEPSLITDFNGFIGLANVDGTGTGTNASGASTTLVFDLDVRFMDGVYIGVDGKTHAGTFGFV